MLRSAAVRHDGSPLNYPVHAVLYGRSDGGKTMFSRVMSRSMFRVDKMIRAHEFTAKRAIGLRDRLGAIPLIIDDVNRDRFTGHVPDLVKFDHEIGEHYAPILISTNKDVTGVAPDLSKRIVVCAIHGARPRSLSHVPAQRALSGIGTALYRAYLNRLTPLVPDMAAKIADDPLSPPDLIRSSSEILADLIAEALGERPSWATQVSLDELDRLKDKPFLDWLREIDEQNRVDRESSDAGADRRFRRRPATGDPLREAGPAASLQEPAGRYGQARSRSFEDRVRLRRARGQALVAGAAVRTLSATAKLAARRRAWFKARRVSARRAAAARGIASEQE